MASASASASGRATIMAKSQFREGLHELGNGAYAYLQPDGGWGLSNAGLLADSGETLLVDTLMDLPRTRAMLEAMRRAEPAAERIGTLVNTHSNGDHTHGNQLAPDARIIASSACLDEMRHLGSPSEPGSLAKSWHKFGDVGAFFQEVMWWRYDPEGIVTTLPNETFSGEMTVQVGTKEVRLVEVGPAHTRGDVIAYVPADKLVYTGDIAFIRGHPIVWAGPVGNWIKACDMILGWDVETVVPGHGPITDKSGIRALRDYFDYIHRESRQRFDAGMSYDEAARDISLAPYADWLDAERLVVNVITCYREFSGDEGPDFMTTLEAMARLYFERHPRDTAAHLHGVAAKS
jgi:glyoxylase-like metal-dependent hydrolase (beta-lactamase superfamily II)